MCREWEEWSAGRSRRRGERLGRAQDEPKSALQADKVETSKSNRGRVNAPALLNRGRGTQNRLTIYVRATRRWSIGSILPSPSSRPSTLEYGPISLPTAEEISLSVRGLP